METESLTHKIHNVVVEFELGPMFKHGLECSACTLGSFYLRNCQDLIWIHERIWSLHLNDSINKCNAPSGALGSPTWTREVTQGNSEGSWFKVYPSTRDSGEGSEVKVNV